jgi:hypothetical protein
MAITTHDIHAAVRHRYGTMAATRGIAPAATAEACCGSASPDAGSVACCGDVTAIRARVPGTNMADDLISATIDARKPA